MPESKSWGGRRQGAGRPRKYRTLTVFLDQNLQTMLYDSRSHEYVGQLPNGDMVIVDGDVYAEAMRDADCDESKQRDVQSPLVWENNADGDSVRIVKK